MSALVDLWNELGIDRFLADSGHSRMSAFDPLRTLAPLESGRLELRAVSDNESTGANFLRRYLNGLPNPSLLSTKVSLAHSQ
jgi:hypothetical protein